MVWGCMGWNGIGMLIEVQGKMDANQYCGIWMMELWKVLKSWKWRRVSNIFSKTIIQNTHPGRQHNGLKTIIFKYYPGQHNLLTLIPSSISGNMSNNNFVAMKLHPKEHTNCGTGWLMSGIKFHQKYVKTL